MPVKLRKQIMRVGTFQDPEKQFTITTDLMDNWIASFKKMQSDGVPCPIVKDHTETVDSAIGKITDMERIGDYLYAVLEFPSEESASLTLANDVSVKAVSEYRTGIGTYINAIRHVSLTPLPLIPGLGEYELVCSISHIQPPTNVKGKDMKKIVSKIAELLGVDVPKGISNSEELVLAWLAGLTASKANKPTGDENDDDSEPEEDDDEKNEDVEASEETEVNEKQEPTSDSSKKSEDDSSKPAEKTDSTDSEVIKASATEEDEPATEETVDANTSPSVNKTTAKKKKTPVVKKEKPAEEKPAEEKPDKNTTKVKQENIGDVEKIKTENDLAKSAKNITASINSTRKSQLRSFLGRPGISSQKIESWEQKYATSDDLNICCSMQSEYDSLIDGLTCSNAGGSILASNPVIDPNISNPFNTDDETGPQFSEWADKMSKRKGVK